MARPPGKASVAMAMALDAMRQQTLAELIRRARDIEGTFANTRCAYGAQLVREQAEIMLGVPEGRP